MTTLLNYILHIDTYLISLVSSYGHWSYLVIFAVIFAETGLVVTPFLPGDSLLFALGSLAAQPNSPFGIGILFLLLIIASSFGNQINYMIGRQIGPRVFTAKPSKLMNKKHLERAHNFYEKNGGKTIIMARFIPIIRTFAPFVAGISYMNRSQFFFYNVFSALLWVGGLLGFGYFFGSLSFIKENFSIVIYGIIAISLLPPFFLFIYEKMMRPRGARVSK